MKRNIIAGSQRNNICNPVKSSIIALLIGIIAATLIRIQNKYNTMYLFDISSFGWAKNSIIQIVILTVITILSLFRFGKPAAAFMCTLSGAEALMTMTEAFKTGLSPFQRSCVVLMDFMFILSVMVMTMDVMSVRFVPGIQHRRPAEKNSAKNRFMLYLVFCSILYGLDKLTSITF